MVRHCAWGTCRADVRYKESLKGARFITFPSPKTKLETCLRWIKACGRPHEQLNIGRINQNKVVCSTHFVGGGVPSKEFPDPIPAGGSIQSPARPPPKRRRPEDHTEKSNMAKINIELKSRTSLNVQEKSRTPDPKHTVGGTFQKSIQPIVWNNYLRKVVRQKQMKI